MVAAAVKLVQIVNIEKQRTKLNKFFINKLKKILKPFDEFVPHWV